MQTNKSKGSCYYWYFFSTLSGIRPCGRNFFRTQSGSDLLYACGKCIAVWTYLSSDDGEG